MSYYGVRRWLLRIFGLVCIVLGITVVGGSSPEERTGGLLLLTAGLPMLVLTLPVLSRGGGAAAQRRVVRLGSQRRPGLVFRRSRSKRLLFSVGIASIVAVGLVILFGAEYFPPGRFGEDAGIARAIGAVVAVAAAFGLLWRFDRRDTRGLVLLADGLILPTERGRYFVPWQNVASVELEEDEVGHGLVVVLADAARQRRLGAGDAQPVWAHSVGLDTLVAPPHVVETVVRHFWRRPEERDVLGREDGAKTLARAAG